MFCDICNRLLTGGLIDAWGNKMCGSHLNTDVEHCSSCSAFTRREHTLADGRVLCKRCFGVAIKPEDSIENIKILVVDSLYNVGFCDLPVKDISFEVVTAQRLAEVRKEPANTQVKGFTYSTINTTSTLGVVTTRKYKHHIYMLTHLTKEEFAGTLAHELLHVWLFQNDVKMSDKMVEGFCNMGAHLIYSSISDDYAKMRVKSLQENPDPTYGDGFREMFEHFKRLGWAELIKNVKEKPETLLNPHVSGKQNSKSISAFLGIKAKKKSNIMYSELLSSAKPGLIIICIDQSGSMTDSYANSSKSEFAAIAVNRVISEIITSCTAGDTVKDRCQIAVVGYGSSVGTLFNEKTSKLAEVDEFVTLKRRVSDGAGGSYDEDYTLQVFLKPIASGGTPMAEAFQEAYVVAEQFIQSNPDSFPPVVINITDGEPNSFPEAKSEAERLKHLSTSDGNLLLLNAHIANESGIEIKLPNTKGAIEGNQHASFLFDTSSVLPDPLAESAKAAGFNVQDGAKGFVFNADAETLVRFLNFGSKIER